MKKLLSIILGLLFLLNLHAEELILSDSATISLLTCSPGKEVYAKFGHSGLRINDKVNNKDLVFNYGIFSFETEDFYYKFIKGETDYFLGVHPTDLFLSEYESRNSTVWEQTLNLTPTEKRKIINALLDNYRPENRMYRYNYVFDNCATRPRDKVLNYIDGYVEFQSSNETKTFRQWIAEYVGTETWLKFGIDIVFGMDADRMAKQYESMFLPEILMNEFEQAKIKTVNNSNNRRLVKENNVLVQSKVEEHKAPGIFSNAFISLSALLAIGILLTLYENRIKKHSTFLDSLLLFASGIAGIIVFYLMFVSIHPLVKNNLNLLWLNPLNVIAAVLIWFKKMRFTLFIYQLINIGFLVLSLIVLALSIQTFNSAAFPLIVLLLIRYSNWVVRIKHRLFRKSKFLIKNN